MTKSIALIFDTETTGKWDFKAPADAPHQPSMVQLGFRLVNLATGQVLQTYSAIIAPEQYDSVDPEAEAVHGISIDVAKKYGVGLFEAYTQFSKALSKADGFICHNIKFDTSIIIKVMHYLNTSIFLKNIPQFCTMNDMSSVLKLKSPYGYKWPSLQELHKYCFGEGFEGAHDALIDVLATERCAIKLYKEGIIRF